MFKNSQNVQFNLLTKDHDNYNEVYFSNLGIRKAVLLTQYVSLIKKWIKLYSENKNNNPPDDDYIKKIQTFQKYFVKEMIEIEDKSLKKEVEILDLIVNKTHWNYN